MKKILMGAFILAMSGALAGADPNIKPLTDAEAFPLVLGTQTIGPAYHFTADASLLESAKAIAAMGSNTIKFSLSRGNYSQSVDHTPPAQIQTLRDLVEHDTTYRAVLAMPFAHTLLWVYPWQKSDDHGYQEIYDLTTYLLKTYHGTGRTFYLGNWEGDWELLRTDPNHLPSAAEIKEMIDRTNARQKAVDQAKRNIPHDGIEVYQYLEVNRVHDAMNGLPRLANLVLPYTPVDFVSYSAYDSLSGDTAVRLTQAMNYLQKQMPTKPGIDGRRVFIGEYGFPLKQFSPADQDADSRIVMKAALSWGCRFCLYWEMYNNELDFNSKDVGYSLIDSHDNKLPVYFTHKNYFDKVRRFVSDSLRATGHPPTTQAFIAAAPGFVD